MHYVYYLHDAESGPLLYIGRSKNPLNRKKSFEKKHDCKTRLGICQRHSDFDKACQAEIKAIAKHWPPFNKRLVSSPGYFQVTTSEDTKTKLRKAGLGNKNALGWAMPEKHKMIVSLAMKGNKHGVGSLGRLGKKHTKEAKSKMSLAKLGNTYWVGRKHSEESKAKMSAARLRRVS